MRSALVISDLAESELRELRRWRGARYHAHFRPPGVGNTRARATAVWLVAVRLQQMGGRNWVLLRLPPVLLEHPPDHQIHPSVVHPLSSSDDALFRESQPLGDRATAPVFGPTADLHAMQSHVVEEIIQHHDAASRDQALTLMS